MNLVFLSFWFGAAKFGFATTSSLSPPACSVFRNLSFIPSRCCFDRKFRREHARGELFISVRYKTLFAVRMLSSIYVSFSYCDILPIRVCRSWFQVFLRIRERNRWHIRFFLSRNPKMRMIWARPPLPSIFSDTSAGFLGPFYSKQIIIQSYGFTIEGFKIGSQGIWILFAVSGLLSFLLPTERLLKQKINKKNTISQTE